MGARVASWRLTKLSSRILIMLVAAKAFAIAVTPAYAANWVKVIADRDNSIYYYDIETIYRSGSQVVVWEKSDKSPNNTQKIRQQIVQIRYDCVSRTSTILQFTSHHMDGKVETFDWGPHEQTIRHVTPGTIAERLLDAVCLQSVQHSSQGSASGALFEPRQPAHQRAVPAANSP